MIESPDVNFKELPINPDRFCEGISKIGYRPPAAIMDIVDNSVAAGATKIEIELVIRAGTTNSASGNVEGFRVYDNGTGMTGAQIDVALEIGSEVEYPKNSLSKFGFGLKSAGFSLGRRIEVTSTAEGAQVASKFVDRDVILSRRQYGICDQKAPAFTPEWFSHFSRGTVVEITKTPIKQDSAAKIRKELIKKLGITYFPFLARANEPLRITIKIGGEVEAIKPLDLLFWGDALDQFDPDTYEAKLPCKVYEGSVLEDLFTGDEKISLQIAIFPMDKMKKYAGFTLEESARIASYAITRENSGFFFYRNGRLIRWGDKLAGVTRDDIGFRARVDFSTVHDELFGVDVSKQNLELSQDFEDGLTLLCRTPLADAKEAFAICVKKLKLGLEDEGETFNERTEVFEETDPIEEDEPLPLEVKLQRKAGLEAETKEREKQEGAENEANAEKPANGITPHFQRVRYSDQIIGMDVAVPGTDRHEGTYVRINRNHQYYDSIIKHFEPAAPARLAIEALLWAGAVAETKTRENVSELSLEALSKVFTHFRKVLSQNLDAWATNNLDLFD